MNGADLNLPGKSRVVKIHCTLILNNDGMVACGFLGIKCARFTVTEVHVTQSTQRKR